MIDIDSLTAKTILSDEVFEEIMAEEDLLKQARLIIDLTAKAGEFNATVKKQFETLLKATEKMSKQRAKSKNLPSIDTFDGYTDLDSKYPKMFSGAWIVNDNGIRTIDTFGREVVACYQPIIPAKRLVNLETEKEKMILAYRQGRRWREKTVEKEVIANASKLVSLSPYGINVTTENSKYLVRYLSDIENYNLDLIPTQMSTSKLGWVKKEFIPYSKEIVFDDETKFKDTFESIHEQGSLDVWMNLVKDIRKVDRFEPKIEIVASLASVLLEPLNALPFILNIGGDTGKGKTVSMMVATSCWANPAENTYMADAKGTVVSIEMRMNLLNNFPMMIDDMSQVKKEYDGDFTKLVYLLCAGKGKDRSNVNLGLNKSTSWKNIILTNYEYLLVTETMQGGAINRIIDVEASDGLMIENGNEVVEIISNNYGFAGRMFLDAVNQIGQERIRDMQNQFYNDIVAKAKVQGVEKEEKQILPMSILLTADKIATEYIFLDGIYLDFETCVNLLKNKGQVSENERAYQFVLSEISINISKFKPDPTTLQYRGDVWGCVDNDWTYIQKNIFSTFAKKGNFSESSFLSWAKKKGILDATEGRNLKQKRFNGEKSWCVCLKMCEDAIDSKDDTEFVTIPEDMQGTLPFE